LLRNFTQNLGLGFLERASQRKIDTKFGTQNIRSLGRVGSLKPGCKGINKVQLRSSGSTRGQMGQQWQSCSRRVYIFYGNGNAIT